MKSISHHSLVLVPFIALFAIACTAAAPESDQLSSTTQTSAVIKEGVPGGVKTTVTQLTATVSAIDYKKRSVTLEDDKGNKKTLVIGPEAVNFEQVKKGDVVKIAVAEEMMVYLREKGAPASEGADAVVARAPQGNKPAMIVAGTEEITTKVIAIDLKAHTATLQFPDGSSKTVAVRPDVDLKKAKIGQEVSIRMTAAMALSVEKP